MVWLPGEIIPFRDAVLAQSTLVKLEPGARLALAEVLSPGRLAMGEREAYSRLDLRLRLELADRPILIERAVLDPAKRPPSSVGRSAGLACVGSLCLVGFDDARALGQSEGAAPVWWGSGQTADGHATIVRLLGRTAQAVRRQIEELLDKVTVPTCRPAMAAPARNRGAGG